MASIVKKAVHRLLEPLHQRQALATLQSLETRLDTPETRLAIPFIFRGKGSFKSIKPMQSQDEFKRLYQKVVELKPRRVVEIGTCHGGTLYLWCQAAAADATLVSIDLPGGQYGGGYAPCREPFYRSFASPTQTMHLVRADSHSPATVDRLKSLIGTDPIDFLFIDGDHTYKGVKQDYELYSPLVRKGGLIALHDIAARPKQPDIEVWQFWRELKAAQPVEELLESHSDRRVIGIGLLRKQ